MNSFILLDSGPLSLATNPKADSDNLACLKWLNDRLGAGDTICVPEIIDYELRRVLIRADKSAGLRRLNRLIATVAYEPLTTDAMRQAAEFWALARKQGKASADDIRLDCDMILAAQAYQVSQRHSKVVVATTNVRHLGIFVAAAEWGNIQ